MAAINSLPNDAKRVDNSLRKSLKLLILRNLAFEVLGLKWGFPSFSPLIRITDF